MRTCPLIVTCKTPWTGFISLNKFKHFYRRPVFTLLHSTLVQHLTRAAAQFSDVCCKMPRLIFSPIF
jgi:hypothetical protein